MDLSKAIRDLYAERDRLERVITSLEELQRKAEQTPDTRQKAKRRGRKSMGERERQEVSERMKKYWAARRSEDPGKAGPETRS